MDWDIEFLILDFKILMLSILISLWYLNYQAEFKHIIIISHKNVISFIKNKVLIKASLD